jgi:hypothetical protein
MVIWDARTVEFDTDVAVDDEEEVSMDTPVDEEEDENGCVVF